jgi:hypothetical protein
MIATRYAPREHLTIEFSERRPRMDFNWSNLEPKANDWLQLNLRYEGEGIAHFSSPGGSVQGPGAATFDELGSTSIEIAPESLSIDSTYKGGPLGFFHGAKVEESEGRKTIGIGGLDNPCESLSITSSEGTFSSTKGVRLVGLSIGGKEQKPLKFNVWHGKFETSNQNTPKYFAFPLFNCLAKVSVGLSSPHPLRIYPTPLIPSPLSDKDSLFAKIKANEKNSLIPFLMDNRLCFVERLADYADRVTSLQSGSQRRITAVLVGELANQPVSTLADFRSWFPFEVLTALSFGSGIEIGLPWIEIRDGNGELIRRLHGALSLPHFWNGDPLLREFDIAGDFGGLGEFLTRYLNLPGRERSYLEVVMGHARVGSLGAPLPLYDILDHLIRALECLCREHGFTRQDLLLGLSDHTREKVNAVISQATKEIRQLENDARAAGATVDCRLLSTITGRAANIGTTENKFGLAVVSLLQSFGFPDADIIDRFLTNTPRSDGLRDWASVITAYRNATIHEGYMDFEKKHDIQDVVRICNHLKDVIARIVFRESKYDGTYESPLLQGFGPQPIDWVKPHTTADKLGFD